MASPLITTRELALWTTRDPEVVALDEWALEVIEKFSDYARFLGGQSWANPVTVEGEVLVPFDVRMAVLVASKRTYGNPDAEVSTTVGPISSRILDEAAIVGAFTDKELEMIQGYHPDGAPSAGGGLWVQPLTSAAEPLASTEVLFVPDDQQVNLSSTNVGPSWDIPMFNPGDPGSEG